MDEVKRLKCNKCNCFVRATNKMGDTRFYCSICGKNLGCYAIHGTLDVKDKQGVIK